MTKLLATIAAALLLAAGCGGDEPRSAATGPGAGCTPRGPALKGDVDGDQASDSTRIYKCRGHWSVVVDGTRGTVVADLSAQRPRLGGLATIDAEPGLEVVVETGSPKRGVVELYSERRGRLLHMTIQSTDRPQFLFGGNAAIRHAVDCIGGPGSRRVVFAEAVRNGSDSIVTRYFYDVSGLQFLADLNPQGVFAHDRLPSSELEERFPEFGVAPFGSCMDVTAAG